jgi:hypothetical protein
MAAIGSEDCCLGAGCFIRRDPERAIRRMTEEANRLGLTVRFDPIPTA